MEGEPVGAVAEVHASNRLALVKAVIEAAPVQMQCARSGARVSTKVEVGLRGHHEAVASRLKRERRETLVDVLEGGDLISWYRRQRAENPELAPVRNGSVAGDATGNAHCGKRLRIRAGRASESLDRRTHPDDSRPAGHARGGLLKQDVK